MDEFGLFSDEGLVEGEFCSREEAVAALAARYSKEDDLHIAAVCHDHPWQERANCEACNAEIEP